MASDASASAASFSNLHHVLTIKLNNSNFLLWKTQFEPILYSNNLMSLLDGTEQCPSKLITSNDSNTPTVNPAYLQWFHRDQLLLSWINSSLSESVLRIVIGKKTSKDAWDAIHSAFATSSETQILQIMMQLHNEKKGDRPIEDYLYICKAHSDHLAANGKNLSISEFNVIVFNNLGADYIPIVHTLMYKSTPVTFPELLNALKNHEQLLQANLPRVDLPSANVVFKQQPYKNKPFNNQHNRSGFYNPRNGGFSHNNGGSMNSFRNNSNHQNSGYYKHHSNRQFPRRHFDQNACQLCFQSGHYASNCPSRYVPPPVPHTPAAFSHSPFGPSICQLCTQVGHTATSCPSRYAMTHQTHYNTTHLSIGFDPNLCQLCLQSGHSARNCPSLPLSSSGTQPQAHYSAALPEATAPSPSLENWFTNTGATHHLTANSQQLQNLTPYNGTEQVIVGDGKGLFIAHSGSFSIPISHDRSLHMSNILHVPQITKNLLPDQQFTKANNCFFEFHSSGFVVKDSSTGTPLLQGRLEDSLYKLQLSKPQISAYLGEHTSLTTWHNRLGHAHHHKVQSIVKTHKLPITSSLSFGSNLVYSPLSIHVVLSLISAGSTGQTLTQLLSFLKSKTNDELNEFCSQLVSVVFSDGSSVGGPKLCFANGVWIDNSLEFKASFKQVVDNVYKAASNQVDFKAKAIEVSRDVNLWAEKETSGLIKEVLPAGSVDQTTRLIFANALYFKGAWNEKFDASATKDNDFHLLDGSSVKVPFMTSKKKQYVSAFNGFKVLGLPYNQGEDKRRFSMYFILPDAKDGLPALVENVASEQGFLDRHIPSHKVEVGDFRIPRFKISFGIEASRVLKGLGLALPFSGEEGLTEMVDSPQGRSLYVSSIHHKSFIEVNEEGTEAAAATSGVIKLRSLAMFEKLDFVADHPFLFLIKEDVTGVVMFIGHVVNPLAG